MASIIYLLTVFNFKNILKLALLLMLILGVFIYIIYSDFQNFKQIIKQGNINLVFYNNEEVKFGYNIDFSKEGYYKELILSNKMDYDILKGDSDLLILLEIDSLDNFLVERVNIRNIYLTKSEILRVLKGEKEIEGISKSELLWLSIKEEPNYSDLINLYQNGEAKIYKEPLSLILLRKIGILNLLESYINK